MASLATHFTASLLLFPIGVRRLTSSTSLYLKNPSHFRAKPWYLSESEPKWKNIDLYTLLVFLPASSLSLVSIFLELPESTNPTYRFSFLQQSFVVLLFWALATMVVYKESLDLYSISESFLFVCAGAVFFIDSYMCGRGLTGLSGEAYGVLSGLSVVCGWCCVFLSVRPCAFFAEFIFSCGLVLKGSWLMQLGFSLYTDVLGLKGCKNVSGQGLINGDDDDIIKCELEDDKWRGIALVNLLLVVHFIAVVVTGLASFGFLNRCKNLRCGGSEGMLMQPLPEIEIE